jgi:ACS family tartrate transporter-like MFS transporter
MGFSNFANGFVMVLPFAAGAGAMIAGGRSSSRRGERIWHVALPWLLAASAFAAASAVQSYSLVLVALTIGLIGLFAAYGPFWSLPTSFLRGTAAAGGIALINTIGNLGAFIGPSLFGVLKQGSGNYASGMAAIAFGMMLAALIVIAVGRTLAPRRAAIPKPSAAE